MADHQLNRADVHSIAQEPAGAFVTEVVPVQVDLAELLAVDAHRVSPRFVSWPFATSGNDSQAVLKFATNSPADEPNTNACGPRAAQALENRRHSSLWIEGNAAVLRILRVPAGIAI